MTLFIKPDASVTLNDEWDAYGMVEIKSDRPNNQRDYLIDNDKCVLMTATTAIALKKSINALKITVKEKKEHYEKVVLPFIIITRKYASLYVTRLNERGNPEVNHVVYPGDAEEEMKDCAGKSKDYNRKNILIQKSPCDARKELFVAFAVLLNRFKTFFDKSAIETKYEEQLEERSEKVKFIDKLTLTGTTCGTGKGKGTKNKDNNESSCGRNLQSKSRQEQCAKEAAQYGGMFMDLEYPFRRVLNLEDDYTDNDDDELVARFYFKGRSKKSTVAAATQDVFLKVWRANAVDIESIASEWMHHTWHSRLVSPWRLQYFRNLYGRLVTVVLNTWCWQWSSSTKIKLRLLSNFGIIVVH